jgi:16S rRNA A1518/A1519 N6-dimethyltransferase RsmA/KsgA/DIM1 with predicted DNA glycosylase/AP lyase activity
MRGDLIMSFDNDAMTWDTDKRIDRARIIADKISNSISFNENYSVMEFGCGTGLVSFNLYKKYRSIALVDSSKGMIDILNLKIKKYQATNMVAYHLDISNKILLDMKFDGHNGFNQDYLKNTLSSCGFNDIESNTFYYDEKTMESEKVKYSLFLMKGRV